jgi:hypothetical protein
MPLSVSLKKLARDRDGKSALNAVVDGLRPSRLSKSFLTAEYAPTPFRFVSGATGPAGAPDGEGRATMRSISFLKRAGAVGAIAVTLTAAPVPNAAYARHGSGAGIALGILGGVLAGAAIASSQPGYAAAPAYYYQPPPTYYAPQPSYYYGPSEAYYSPPPAYYQPAPYGYAAHGDYQ